jgi:hypothetical protein
MSYKNNIINIELTNDSYINACSESLRHKLIFYRNIYEFFKHVYENSN